MKDLDRAGAPVVLVDDEELILKSFLLNLKSGGINDVVTLVDSRKLLRSCSSNRRRLSSWI